MADQQEIFSKLTSLVADAPGSASALTMYALVSTMNYEQAGCLFKLNKLRDLDAEQRNLAYQLMELMAESGNSGSDWDQLVTQLETLVRAG